MRHDSADVANQASLATGNVVTPRRVNVHLRPWEPHEAAWYVTAIDDEIVRWTRESPTMDPEKCGAALQAAAGRWGQRSLAIVDAAGGGLLGNCGIARSGTEAELSYWIAAEARGRGAATAALVAGTELALRDPEVNSCFLLIHPDNRASIRVAERAAYRFVGTRTGPPDCCNEAGLVAVYRYPAE